MCEVFLRSRLSLVSYLFRSQRRTERGGRCSIFIALKKNITLLNLHSVHRAALLFSGIWRGLHVHWSILASLLHLGLRTGQRRRKSVFLILLAMIAVFLFEQRLFEVEQDDLEKAMERRCSALWTLSFRTNARRLSVMVYLARSLFE